MNLAEALSTAARYARGQHRTFAVIHQKTAGYGVVASNAVRDQLAVRATVDKQGARQLLAPTLHNTD